MAPSFQGSSLFNRLSIEENNASESVHESRTVCGIPTTIVFLNFDNYNVLFVSQKCSSLGGVYRCSFTSQLPLAHERSYQNVDIECLFGAKECGNEIEVVIARRIYQLLLTSDKNSCVLDKIYDIEKPLVVSILIDYKSIESSEYSDKHFAMELIQSVKDVFRKPSVSVPKS
ncbi:glutamyl-tRNA reductase [Perkinsela sp. CCAP 1560/4]|nr:glutamyl-tRNA reductase [Perkinsela sp. CCAP 1560/4]|eukprot:KNH09335.1 glutamyl-tRNA reductase [Perkinsela sp. CCAP 1560/4]